MKRKIIEIYVTENEDDSAKFEFVKTEDSDIANIMIRTLVEFFMIHKDDDDSLEIEIE